MFIQQIWGLTLTKNSGDIYIYNMLIWLWVVIQHKIQPSMWVHSKVHGRIGSILGPYFRLDPPEYHQAWDWHGLARNGDPNIAVVRGKIWGKCNLHGALHWGIETSGEAVVRFALFVVPNCCVFCSQHWFFEEICTKSLCF